MSDKFFFLIINSEKCFYESECNLKHKCLLVHCATLAINFSHNFLYILCSSPNKKKHTCTIRFITNDSDIHAMKGVFFPGECFASASAVVVFPSTAVSVTHQIKAVINKMGLLLPSSLFSPSPFTQSLQHMLVSQCLHLCQLLSLFSFSPSGYHRCSLSAFPPA